jgi:hypothetical protein
MALELVCAMSGEKHMLPADMLLLRERQRRLAHTPRDQPAVDAHADDVLHEGDAIVRETASALPGATASYLALYRPVRSVVLGNLAWSGSIDNDALQSAIVCGPVRAAGERTPPSWIDGVSAQPLSEAPHGEAALMVALHDDEIAVLGRTGLHLSYEAASRLVRAAALPSTIVGAEPSTTEPATASLAAYRNAALVYAWQTALCGSPGLDVARDRDAAAVALMSVLRVLTA